MRIIGVDIGGTKCSVCLATPGGDILERRRLATGDAAGTLARILDAVAELGPGPTPHFGIACGGPLDCGAGLILSPPNLPGWDRIPIVTRLEERFGGRAFLMNDANAGALAEWRFGAGRGANSLVFLTAGTGMGGGLILNGALYEGASGDAGEIGHVRLAPDGPVGYGKCGSVEGFCSGGGIAQCAQAEARRHGGRVAFNPGVIEQITAQDVGGAAERGDALAANILAAAGHQLGHALAILVDLLNPEVIVLGSLYGRCQRFIEPAMRAALAAEALPRPLAGCRIEPAALGESLGDVAAACVALYRAGR